jgi:hypothetical protein
LTRIDELSGSAVAVGPRLDNLGHHRSHGVFFKRIWRIWREKPLNTHGQSGQSDV